MRYDLSSLSDAWLVRLYHRAWDRIATLYDGGLSFGLDWPTFLARTPGWAAVYQSIREEMDRRA